MSRTTFAGWPVRQIFRQADGRGAEGSPGRYTDTQTMLRLAGLSLLGIFSISVAWEFGLEQLVGSLLGIEDEKESVRDHWEYVVTTTVLAGMALILPTMALIRGARANEKAVDRLCESEQRLRGIVENSPAAISLKDADGRYLMVNDQFEKLAGLSRDDIRGKKSDEIFPEDFAESGMDHDREVLRRGQASAREESFDVAGRDHSFLTVKFPIADIGGKVVAIGAIHTNITERKWAEEQILSANARLEQRAHELEDTMEYLAHTRDQAKAANHAKSEFLAMMSHELRTPLNAVIGFSEVMKTEALGPIGSASYREFADDIYASGQHLLELINDILDLSKIESGKARLSEEEIEVAKLVGSVVTLVRESARANEIEIKLDCAADLPDILADRRKLKQILANLLSNGIKFTPAGGRVSLRAWCDADSGHVFQVADTGIGIALEDVPKALAPFQQIDSKLGRKHEGTGLGLPLTKALVELHGGTLDIESEVGVGTTVTLRFPSNRMIESMRIGRPARAS
jgi:PAS domain S-box-containing protein